MVTPFYDGYISINRSIMYLKYKAKSFYLLIASKCNTININDAYICVDKNKTRPKVSGLA